MISVLYVDDEPDLLEVGKLFLERKGEFSISTVTSGREALELLKRSAYEAIISDYQMPEMNGIDLLKQVRASGNSIPFIIFTGRGREEIVIQALNEGADFYIQKGGEPVSQFAELAHKIQKAVLQKRAETSIRDHERRETDIINFLPDATFAIDTRGIVIAWNRAMEKMTGVRSEEILGKGDYEYAMSFYHERRPILIDLVLSDDPATVARYPYVTKEGNKLFSEVTIPHFNHGTGAALWFTASPLYNTRGAVVGAIESIREITERKKAEEALNESEKRFRELADLLPQTVYESDISGKLTYANRIAFEMFGFRPEELERGLTIREMIAPEDRKRAEDAFRNLLAGSSEPKTTEYFALRKDCTTFPVAIYSSPVVIEGRITGIRGIIVDISERRKAEENLQKSEIRFRSLIQNASDMIRILDRQGKIVYESPSTEAILGYPAGENLGKDPLSFIHPDDLDRVNADLREVYNRINEGTPTEFRVRKADGTYLWVDTVATNLLDVPAVNGIVVTTRPIEQRKNLENAIRESEEKYRLVVENSHDAIYIHRDNQLIFVNARSAEVTGYSKSELLNMNIWDLVHPDDRARLQQSAVRRLSGEEVLSSFSARLVTKNGEIREGDFFVDRVDYLGSPAILGIFRDITELNRAARSIVESEEKYRTVFETTGTATVMIEDDATISLANSEFERLSGYRKDEIENKKKWTEFVVQEDRERMLAQHRFRRTDPEKALSHYEFRFLTRSGEIRHTYLSIGLIHGTVKSVASILDLTERKKMEDSLVAANQEYTNLLSQIQDIYYRCDVEGRLVRASASWATLLGYDDITECIGRNIATDFYFNPHERSRFLEQIYQEGKVTNYEVLLKRKDGTSVLVATNSHLSFDSSGNISGIEGTFRDITERKQQEEILRTQLSLGLALQTTRGMEETLRACLEAAIQLSGMDSGGIYLIDEETGSVDLSVWENLTEEFAEAVAKFPAGSSRAQIVIAGKPVYVPFDAIGPDHSPAQIQEGLKAIAILPVTFGTRIIACLNVTSHTHGEIPDSARVALETLAAQIGAAISRIRADEALAESEQRYRNVVEDQTEFISRFLPDGTHIFVNEAYCRYFGLRREEILGHRFRPKIPAEDRQRFQRFFESLTSDHPVDSIEHRIIMPDGSVRWQRWSDRAIFDASGTIIEYQSVGRDVTEKREAEEALHQAYIVVENSPVLLFRWKAQEGWPVAYVSQNITRFGYTADDLLSGKVPFAAMIYPDDLGRISDEVARYSRQGIDQFRQEYRILTRDGGIRWVDDRTVIERDPQGRITHYQGILLDITEQKRIEEALIESEARYRDLSEASPDLIFVIDNSDRVTYVNSSAAEMIRIPAQEIVGRERAGLFPPDVAESQGRAIRSVFETGEPVHSTGKLDFGGGALWFDHAILPIRDRAKNVSHVLGISRNITELKIAEEALRQRTEELDYANRVFTTILDTIPMGIFMVEAPSGKPIIANRKATQLLGRGILPDVTDENLAEVYEAYRAGTSARYPTEEMPIVRGMYGVSHHIDDMVIVRPDSTQVHLEIFGTPVTDHQGCVSASLASFLDITERKRAEEELQVTREKYSKAFLSVPDAITISELDSGKFVEVNDAATELFGYSREELIGKSAIGLGIWLKEEDRTAFIDLLMKTGRVHEFEVTERKKSGELYRVLINADILIVGGRKCLVSILRDISERRWAEQVIREQNRKINLLTSITRHDVANQVSILKGYAQIALMKKPAPVISELLEKIDAAGSTIARQIEFTRTYQDLGLQAPRWFRIRELIERQKREDLQVSCSCDAEIFADPMLEKVFFNLVDNAVRHGERVNGVAVTCRQEQDRLVITAEDDGVGVPDDLKEKIFDKGYGKNTGFGLFLAREILAITGITIRETGVPGKGARFEITVPEGAFRAC